MYRFLDTPRRRSLAGLVAALLFIPLMLGITACLETPIGDPEQGWVDPRITGAWLVDQAGADDYAAELWLFEPYDSRTWLVTVVDFEDSLDDEQVAEQPAVAAPDGASPGDDAALEVPESPSRPLQPSDVLRIVGTLGEDRSRPAGIHVLKAWLTSIADRRFLVLEPKAAISTETGFAPEVWLVYRIVLRDDRMEIAPVNPSTEDLGEVKTRGEAEQIIARHAADPDFYEEGAGSLHRVPREAYDDLAEALGRAGFGSW